MRKCLATAFFAFLATCVVWGQTETTPKVFPKLDKIVPLGVSYHPEQVPEKLWDADFARLAKMGFSFVQIGEDSWSALEPVEGRYDWLWLDRCLDLAARYKLKIVFNTGTSALPPWLLKRTPGVEALGVDGKPYPNKRFIGSTCDPAYKAASERLVTMLAKRYGDNAGIAGWLVPAPPEWDYGTSALTAFRSYIKYKAKESIDTLNMRWGATRTGFTYSAWDEIRLPKPEQGRPPSLALLDFVQMQSEKSTQYLESLISVLDRYTTGQFVSPVYGIKDDVATFSQSLTKHKHEVSAVSFSGDLPTKASPYLFALAHEHTQNGEPSGHSSIPIGNGISLPKPGEVRRLLWQQYGMGARYICLKTEGRLVGLLEADGQTTTRVAQEIHETLVDMEVLKNFRKTDITLPYGLARQQIAVVYTPNEVAAMSQKPLQEIASSIKGAFLSAKAAGVPVQFIGSDKELNPVQYPVALVPAVGSFSPNLVNSWRTYVRKGGRLLLWPGTSQQNAATAATALPLGNALYPLTYTKIEEVYTPTDGDSSYIYMGKPYTVGRSEILFVAPNVADSVKVLARYENNDYRDKPAIVELKLGEGSVIYMGTISEKGIFERQLVHTLLAETGASPMDLPENVYADWNEGLLVITNHSTKAFTPTQFATDRLVGSGPSIEAGGVGVYKWYK